MDQVKFVEDSIKKMGSDMVCLGRPYHFTFYKGCLPQILPSPFLNTLSDAKIFHKEHLQYNVRPSQSFER